MSDRQVTLCECNCMETGRIQERERIKANIQSRITDLKCCTKTNEDDNCREIADLLEQYLPEWLGEH